LSKHKIFGLTPNYSSAALLPDCRRYRDYNAKEYQDRHGGPYQLNQRTLMKMDAIRPIRAPMSEGRIKHGTDNKNAADDANTEYDLVQLEHMRACQHG